MSSYGHISLFRCYLLFVFVCFYLFLRLISQAFTELWPKYFQPERDMDKTFTNRVQCITCQVATNGGILKFDSKCLMSGQTSCIASILKPALSLIWSTLYLKTQADSKEPLLQEINIIAYTLITRCPMSRHRTVNALFETGTLHMYIHSRGGVGAGVGANRLGALFFKALYQLGLFLFYESAYCFWSFMRIRFPLILAKKNKKTKKQMVIFHVCTLYFFLFSCLLCLCARVQFRKILD